MTQDQLPEDDNMLAAEYVLGLLEGADLERAKSRLATDRAFVQLVSGWEAEFVTLTDTLEPQQPPAALKAALLARMFPQAPRAPWWQRVWLWQAVSAAFLVVLAFLFITPLSTPSGPLYTAEITAAEGDFRVIAVVDKAANEVILTKLSGTAPAGRILQVWAHGPDAPALSVGLWPEGDTARLPLPPIIAAVRGTLTLGISEEPPGGSPSGSPSGRVFGTDDIRNASRPA